MIGTPDGRPLACHAIFRSRGVAKPFVPHRPWRGPVVKKKSERFDPPFFAHAPPNAHCLPPEPRYTPCDLPAGIPTLWRRRALLVGKTEESSKHLLLTENRLEIVLALVVCCKSLRGHPVHVSDALEHTKARTVLRVYELDVEHIDASHDDTWAVADSAVPSLWTRQNSTSLPRRKLWPNFCGAEVVDDVPPGSASC